MTVFITGATGYLGSYVVDVLMRDTDDNLALLVRAADENQAIEKLWKAWQLHMDAERFYECLGRTRLLYGDLHQERLGLSDDDYEWLLAEGTSILHIAASLNRKSDKACLNTNLRGTLSVLKIAMSLRDAGRLRRFSHVSTVAVAGQRSNELIQEDTAIEWDRSDYDPYGRTKKFCEHMARELLPTTPLTFFRPSIVMGDSRRGDTSQFDMVRAFCTLADLPIVPIRPHARQDIVNADWVGYAIATLHMKDETDHQIYHLSAGESSLRADRIATAVAAGGGGKAPRFIGPLEPSFGWLVDQLASSQKRNVATYVGSLLKVFLPYITYNTVFDNTRATTELGVSPTPFDEYCGALYRFAKKVDFKYPHLPLPPRPASANPTSESRATEAK
jgi:thioester reductase-like protein